MRRRRDSPLLRLLKARGHDPCQGGVRRLLSHESDEEAIKRSGYGDGFCPSDVDWTAARLAERERFALVLPFHRGEGPWPAAGMRAIVLRILRAYRHGEAVAACIRRTERKAARRR